MPTLTDPETPITRQLLADIVLAMGLREEISPRLMLRSITWAYDQITALNEKIERARHALREQQ
jgi:hypothetical protein